MRVFYFLFNSSKSIDASTKVNLNIPQLTLAELVQRGEYETGGDCF